MLLPHFKIFSGIVLCLVATSIWPQQKSLRFGINQNYIHLFDGPDRLKWSYAIPKHVLEAGGYKVKVVFRPALRLPLSLQRNDIDLTIATIPTLQQYGDDFIRSELPIGMVDFLIYYNSQKAWRPVWPPDAVFKQKKGKSVQSALALRSRFNTNIKQSATVDAAVKMVNQGRIDYYIENGAALSLVSQGLLRSEQQGYKLEVLYTIPAYVYFRNDEHSQEIVKKFNQQLLKLLLQGRFSQVFYNHQDNTVVQDGGSNLVKFINSNYDEYQIPPQPLPPPIPPTP